MLIISDNASALLLLLQCDAGMSGSSGLRIDTAGSLNSLRMSLAEGPEHADATVLGPRGAAVFLSPEAARRLDHQTLQASGADCRPAFYLT